MSKREKAAVLNEKARKLHDKGKLKEAIALYEKAAALDPKWGTPLYNLGLLFKHQRQWVKSLAYNRQATELDAGNQAAWWNMGIAATALGRWGQARAAWRGFGIDIPDSEGPVDFPCGHGPIRLNPDGEAEVVWAERIDPARARVISIPFPESKHRWCDIVLNDGAPVGYRKYGGKDIPVLNAIELLQASAFGTFIAHVALPKKDKSADQLPKIADKLGGFAEDWSTQVRILCQACSEGRTHATHDTAAAPPDGVHIIGIAARSREHASEILHAWEATGDDIHVESLDNALPAGNSE